MADQQVIEELGTVQLRRTVAEYFARCFLESSRFDPMHDAASEQTIYDQADDWLAIVARNGEAELSVEYKGNRFTARVSSAELAVWMERRCQPLIQSLRARPCQQLLGTQA